jgi:hypothetical protein
MEKVCVCGQPIIWNVIKCRYYNYINGVGGIHGTPHRCPQYVNKKYINATPPKRHNSILCCPTCGINYYPNVFVLCPNCMKCKCDRCGELRTYKTGLNICPECGNASFEVWQTKEYVDNIINKLKPT